MFWRFGFVGTSPIDTLLGKDDCTLEQLLDEDELLQEVKSSHQKLLTFLTQPERMRALVEFCVVSAPEDANEKRRYKFPYVASEVLSAGETQISDGLMKDRNLDTLLNFIGGTAAPDSLLAGYFNKVIVALVESHPNELLTAMREKDEFLPSFVSHLENASIADLLIRLLVIDDMTRGHNITLYLCDTHLVMLLVNTLESAEGEQVQSNVAEILMRIAQTHDDFVDGEPTNLYNHLVSAEVVDKLLQCVLNKSDSLLVHGMQILMVILEKQSCSALKESGETSLADLPPVYSRVVANLEKFVALLGKGPGISLTLTYGTLEPPCGHIRVRVVEFLGAVVKGGYKSIEKELVRLNIMPACLDLFFKYPWNNFLGLAVDNLVECVLQGSSDEIKTSVLESYGLAGKLVAEFNTGSGLLVGKRHGNIAFVVKMANAIQSAASGNVQLRNFLDGQAEWKEFVENGLAEQNKLNSMDIGGARPNQMNQDQDDGDDQFNRDTFEMELNNTAQRLAEMKDLDNWREKSFDADLEAGDDGDEFSFEADFDTNMQMNMNPMFDPTPAMDSLAAAERQFQSDYNSSASGKNIEEEFALSRPATSDISIEHDTVNMEGSEEGDKAFFFQPSEEDFAKAMEDFSSVPLEHNMNIRDGDELTVGDASDSRGAAQDAFVPEFEANFDAFGDVPAVTSAQPPADAFDDDL